MGVHLGGWRRPATWYSRKYQISHFHVFPCIRTPKKTIFGLLNEWVLWAWLEPESILENLNCQLGEPFLFCFSLTRGRVCGRQQKNKHTEHERVQFLGTTEHSVDIRRFVVRVDSTNPRIFLRFWRIRSSYTSRFVYFIIDSHSNHDSNLQMWKMWAKLR